MLNNVKSSVQLNDIMAPNNNFLNLKIAFGYGSKFNITKCTSLRCNFKANFEPRSSVTKIIYDCDLTITCELCHLQYWSNMPEA